MPKIWSNWLLDLWIDFCSLVFRRNITFTGFTLSSKIICIKKSAVKNPYAVSHELVHAEQCQLEGNVFKWRIKYFWQLIRHGYSKNSYEIEAFQKMYEYKYVLQAFEVIKNYANANVKK